MTDTEPRTAPTAAAGQPPSGDIFNDPVFLKHLKTAVVVMAVILILGFIAIIARIFQLSSRVPPQPPAAVAIAVPTGLGATGPAATAQGATASAGGAADRALVAQARLALPAGASVRSLSLSGHRLAVHYEAPAGGGIAVVDLETGRTVSRIEFTAASGP